MEMVYQTSTGDNAKFLKRRAKLKKKKNLNKKATGKSLINSLESVGRVTNAIEMENKMMGNPKATKTIVDELANRDQSLTKEDLELNTVDKLPGALFEFVWVARTECADNGCSNFNDFAEGFNILSSIDGLNVSSEIFKEGSPWNIYEIFAASMKGLMEIDSVLTDIDKFKSDKIEENDLLYFYVALQKNALQIIKTSVNQKRIKEMSFDQLKTDMASVSASKQVKEAFKKEGVDIGEWEKTLKPIGKKLMAFQSTFTKEAVDEYRSSSEQLLTTYQKLFNHFEKKVETSGFPNGASDLVKLLEDVKNEFFADHLQVKEGNLKNLFPIVLQLNEQFRAILEIKRAIDDFDVIRTVQKIRTFFEGALAELEPFSTILSLFDCDNMFEEIYDVVWVRENDLIVKNEKPLKNFIEKLKVPEFEALPELLEVFRNMTGFSKAIREFGKFDEVKDELKTFKQQLNENGFDSIERFLEYSNIEKLIEYASKMRKPGKFLTCIPNQEALKKAKDRFGGKVSMSNLQSLETIKVDKILYFCHFMKSYWNRIEKTASIKKPKNKASANSSLADGTSRKLNEAIHIFVGLKRRTHPKQFPSGIDGIRSLVKHPLQIDGNVDIELRRISRFLVDLGAPFPKKEDATVLEQMLMEFANGSLTLEKGKKSLENVMLYFGQLSNETGSGLVVVSDKPHVKDLSMYGILLICLSCFVWVGLMVKSVYDLEKNKVKKNTK
uniref:WSN domain-containing protein n=1 Tax=Caenorhabditis tropicalis TaxID=1561998 RepID=A0A1I7UJ67_9PELO